MQISQHLKTRQGWVNILMINLVFSPKQHFYTKGQLISKRNSQAEDSPKKRTNEFVFTSMRSVFVRFLGESSARIKSFRDYLTFRKYEL